MNLVHIFCFKKVSKWNSYILQNQFRSVVSIQYIVYRGTKLGYLLSRILDRAYISVDFFKDAYSTSPTGCTSMQES